MKDNRPVWKPHVTVASVAEKQGQFLMVEEIISNQTLINQPAGHLEDDESLIEAAARECMEETGWIFRPEYLIGIYRWKQPVSSAVFLRFTFGGQLEQHCPDQPLDEGILAASWMSRDVLVQQSDRLRSPLVLQSIDDYLAGNSYPLSLLSVIE